MDDPTAEALFLGEKSKTADQNALMRAKKFKQQGVDRGQILKDTGWFEDRGRWNYETDDRDFKQIKPFPQRTRDDDFVDAWQGHAGKGTVPSAEIDALNKKWEGIPREKYFDFYNAPGVKEAYPILNTLRLRITPADDHFGSFGYGNISINRGAAEDEFAPPDKRKPIPESELELTALHELQHAADEANWGPHDEEFQLPYKDRPSEMRARNVEMRRNMTPEERRQIPPWETEPAGWEHSVNKYRKFFGRE